MGDEADVGEHSESVDAGAKDDERFWFGNADSKEGYSKRDLCPKENEVDL